MGCAEHDDLEADATRAFRVFRPPSADGIRYADSGSLPEGAPPPDDDRLPKGAPPPDDSRLPDADTGTFPVLDWYAGYERYADDQSGQSQAGAEEPSFTRAYARPADPRQAPPSSHDQDPPTSHDQDPPTSHDQDPPTSHDQDPWSRGSRPAALPPLTDLASAQLPPADFASDRHSLGEHAQELPLAARLARLRPDRWILAGGGLAATVAVIVAFTTAGGSTATPGARTAQTATLHTIQPACVSPVPGH
jgi:hypothetical protein